ncbi:hypothetical protein FHP29_14655 [Nocardioides albidus]|uniref:AMP-binding enzyme C-terminal domain-containing protein n=1 Tax=Nocardioides albidus TaxID=1517589 RepID=A0A5C4VRG8_9ACTN|nr:hypothetical protein [Nocardioides albidus]TNM38483.1 hypothetical protein FHP29_14655 [Nocardioides albidus]
MADDRVGERGGLRRFQHAFLGAPLGSDHADDVMGEKVGAVLFAGDQSLDVDVVISHCRTMLADFKVPQFVAVTAATPPQPRGKLLKGILRENVSWTPVTGRR